jgi:hypothetical protein
MTKRLNIDIIAKDKSQQALKQVQGNLNQTKSSVINLKNALIGLGAGAVLKGFVDTGKEVESLQVRFKFLFGSLEEGATAFDNLTKFAARVPFSLEEISRASGNLAVVADDANDLNRILEITGNVAAVTGLDFETTSSQIQRAFSGGIGAADLFRERGVRALLGFQAGAKVTAEETIKRFEELFAGDGQFAKATNDLAQTLEGTLSMLGDKYFKFQKDVSSAFFDELKKEFGDLDKFLKQNEDSIRQIAVSFGTVLAQSITTTGDAIKFVKENFEAFKILMTAIISLKLASIFYGLSTALYAAAAGMTAFNVATRKNLIVMGVAAAVTGIITFREKIEELAEALGLIEKSSPLKIEMDVGTGLVYTDRILRIINHDLLTVQQTIKETNPVLKSFKDGFEDAMQKAIDITDDFKNLGTKAFNGFADSLTDAIMTGKASFKDFARSILADLLRIIIRQRVALTLQKAFQIGSGMSSGGGIIAGVGKILGFANGGTPPVNKPSLVGERGVELFLPKTSGTIIPNEQLPQMAGTTNINFTINTVDAQGVDELLTNRRSTIINVINDALNRQGKEALV